MMHRRDSLLRFLKSWPCRSALTLLLLAFIFWRLGGIGTVARLIGSASVPYAALTLVVITADRLLMTYKWTRLLRAQKVDMPLIAGTKIYCASMVWGLFLPSTVGADAVRAFRTYRFGVGVQQTVASILVERILGFLASMVMGMAGLLVLSGTGILDDRFDRLWWAAAAVLATITLAFGLSFHSRVVDLFSNGLPKLLRDTAAMRRLREFQRTYRRYRHEKRVLAGFFGLTLFEHAVSIFYVWLVARALNVPVSLLVIAGAVPLAMLVSRIPVTIQGIGVFEGVFMLLLSAAGAEPAQAVAIALVMRLLEVVAWMPWWVADVVGDRDRLGEFSRQRAPHTFPSGSLSRSQDGRPPGSSCRPGLHEPPLLETAWGDRGEP